MHDRTKPTVLLARHTVRLGLLSAGALYVLAPSVASAQTWARGTTPRLGELVAVDRTGETNWPYGAEDVAGDGATFAPAEQAFDLRTGYAATDAQGLWVRGYVSSTVAPPATVSLYVFVDSDHSAATGGDAVATQVSPLLAADPSPGGYEYFFGVDGSSGSLGVWQWSAAQAQWTTFAAAQTTAEAGATLDPIRFDGDTHGYLQGRVDLARIGLTATCDAVLFLRSVDTAGNHGDTMTAATCVPVDANGDGVADVINTTCTSDANCPAGGKCVNGRCVFTASCTTNADCAANQVCTNGTCVAAPGGSCTTTADCTGGLVCQGGQCVACTASTQCPGGRTCAPNGTCVTGTSGGNGGSPAALAPGEEIQGGACACSLPARDGSRSAAWLAVAAFIGSTFVRRRRRR